MNDHYQAECKCREACPRSSHRDRVCGSDGITYRSRCALDVTSCRLSSRDRITMVSNGSCPGVFCHLSFICNDSFSWPQNISFVMLHFEQKSNFGVEYPFNCSLLEICFCQTVSHWFLFWQIVMRPLFALFFMEYTKNVKTKSKDRRELNFVVLLLDYSIDEKSSNVRKHS